MSSNNFRKDLKLSLEMAWIIYSLIILSVLILSAFLPESLAKISPVCISKVYGEECFMCGMTGAFIEIPKGNFLSAHSLNGFSLILFTVFILNEILFLYYSALKIRGRLNFKNTVSKISNMNFFINQK